MIMVKQSKNWLNPKNIKNLAKFKSLKNSCKCKKKIY